MATHAHHRASPTRAWLVVLAVCAGSAIVRYRYLASTGTPVGIDGYYYLVQVRSILEDGRLYYPSAPLVLWLMAAVAKLGSPLVGVQLVAAVGTAAIGIPIMGAGQRLGFSPISAAIAAIAATTAPSSLYLSAEFAKNGVALTIACAYLWAVAIAIAEPEQRTAWLRTVALLVATALAHKLALVFALALSTPALLALRRRWVTSAVVVTVLAIVGTAALIPEHLPGVSAAAGLTRMWSTTARWSLPIFALPGHELRFSFDVAIAAALAIASLVIAVYRRPAITVGAAALWTLVVAIPYLDVGDTNGLGPRLRLTAFVSMALCAPFVIDTLTTRWRRSTRFAVLAGVAVGLVAARPWVPVEGVVRIAAPMKRALANLPRDSRVLIVPERQLVFAATWHSRMRATLQPEAVPREQRLRLLPGWFSSPELTVAIRACMGDPPPAVEPPRALDPEAPLALVAVSEATWEHLLTRLPATQQAHYRSWPTL